MLLFWAELFFLVEGRASWQAQLGLYPFFRAQPINESCTIDKKKIKLSFAWFPTIPSTLFVSMLEKTGCWLRTMVIKVASAQLHSHGSNKKYYLGPSLLKYTSTDPTFTPIFSGLKLWRLPLIIILLPPWSSKFNWPKKKSSKFIHAPWLLNCQSYRLKTAIKFTLKK